MGWAVTVERLMALRCASLRTLFQLAEGSLRTLFQLAQGSLCTLFQLAEGLSTSLGPWALGAYRRTAPPRKGRRVIFAANVLFFYFFQCSFSHRLGADGPFRHPCLSPPTPSVVKPRCASRLGGRVFFAGGGQGCHANARGSM